MRRGRNESKRKGCRRGREGGDGRSKRVLEGERKGIGKRRRKDGGMRACNDEREEPGGGRGNGIGEESSER